MAVTIADILQEALDKRARIVTASGELLATVPLDEVREWLRERERRAAYNVCYTPSQIRNCFLKDGSRAHAIKRLFEVSGLELKDVQVVVDNWSKELV